MELNYCTKCGLKLDDEYNFCPKCGTERVHAAEESYEKQVDEFFKALESATEEERNEFFKLIEQDLKKKKEGK